MLDEAINGCCSINDWLLSCFFPAIRTCEERIFKATHKNRRPEDKNDSGPAVAFNHYLLGGVGFRVVNGSATGVWVQALSMVCPSEKRLKHLQRFVLLRKRKRVS